MTKRDKIGLTILVLLFVVFGLLLAWTVRPHSSNVHDFKDSVFVKQRMKNLEKGKH